MVTTTPSTATPGIHTAELFTLHRAIPITWATFTPHTEIRMAARLAPQPPLLIFMAMLTLPIPIHTEETPALRQAELVTRAMSTPPIPIHTVEPSGRQTRFQILMEVIRPHGIHTEEPSAPAALPTGTGKKECRTQAMP